MMKITYLVCATAPVMGLQMYNQNPPAQPPLQRQHAAVHGQNQQLLNQIQPYAQDQGALTPANAAALQQYAYGQQPPTPPAAVHGQHNLQQAPHQQHQQQQNNPQMHHLVQPHLPQQQVQTLQNMQPYGQNQNTMTRQQADATAAYVRQQQAQHQLQLQQQQRQAAALAQARAQQRLQIEQQMKEAHTKYTWLEQVHANSAAVSYDELVQKERFREQFLQLQEQLRKLN